jgi:molecular chaperone DnaK
LAASRLGSYLGSVAEETRTPVAIRISRPYGSEEEFLQHEIDTLTRTTVILLGAQSRPQGVVLRFEIALASGDTLIRGEGRVVGFRAASQGVDSGLTLRFTRLDARSKALVDRAAAMREARAKASLHPPRHASVQIPAATPPRPPPLPREAEHRADPAPDEAASSGTPAPSHVEASRPSKRPRGAPPPLPPVSGTVTREAPSPQSIRMAGVQGARREELLDRLRQRAKTLSPSAVEKLLASRARRA